MKELLDHGKSESEEAELELMEQHRVDYEKIYAHLKKRTNTFSEELTYLIRLYEAIGFLGRNLRFSDSPSFYPLQYFIQRYLSDATLELEFRHLWKVYKDLTGHKTPRIIIDSMGIDSRRKSLFAKIHGRYRTIGFADLSAISLYRSAQYLYMQSEIG